MSAAAELFASVVYVALVELALFASVCFLVAGLDELLVDLIWFFRAAWRRLTVYRSHARTHAADLPDPKAGFRLAVFIPAWDEAAVIAPMLRNAVAAYENADVAIFVGCYPNDRATIAAATSVSSGRVRVVIGQQDGPTTKADCLNTLWRAVARTGEQFSAIMLHDAEDVVSPHEARVVAYLIERFGLIQLPVVPLIDNGSRWVSGHYCDEFAESHGKTLIVREALGAGLPLAGVGCAIRTGVLERLAAEKGGRPFDDGSLTEDYETGLTLSMGGARAAFVRMLDQHGGALVATRAHFPASFDAAAQQKSRWIIGIAIAGWDRLGWGRGLAENWMRLRDRQGLIAAIALVAGYLAFLLGMVTIALELAGYGAPVLPQALQLAITICSIMLVWRLGVRAFFVGRIYGVAEAMRSVPRAMVANAIAIIAARRAVIRYLTMRANGRVEWDKTAHKFPGSIA